MCRSIKPLSKIIHQVWCNHPFSQRNKQKKVVRVEVGGDREGGVGQNLKKGGVGNIEGSS